MVKQTIQIFCRVRPSKRKAGVYEINKEDPAKELISFNVPKDAADGYINNKKENYKFLFDRVFEQNTTQDEVFEQVASPVIENVIEGYNGTLFAYGQTGSGKTFTITGGAERYIDRGIIPRSLSQIFQCQLKDPGMTYTTHISYLEVYNNDGYDLLDPNHDATKLEDLPKVSMLEDTDGNVHLKNLSVHSATNEEEALNLLFLGDTNRMIAETPMNQASTRSHCIFTIHLTVKQQTSALIRRSKLHLVDLAGSERVGKTGVGGTLLKEAKCINLSLHFLEQVIIALSEKSRNHVPYRNSMLTAVLRDSLGGNCMTSMIATCSVDKENIDESISTCRFAQRVALIKNDALLNEELDPKLLIAKLKKEIAELRDELSLATGVQYDGQLTDEEIDKLIRMIESYVENPDENCLLSVGADMRKINFCFAHFKKLCLQSSNTKEQNSTSQSLKQEESSRQSVHDLTYLAKTNEMDKLKELILQRDNEINILVGMLKKEKERNSQKQETNEERESKSDDFAKRSLDLTQESVKRNALVKNLQKKNNTSVGRQAAFETFKQNYKEFSSIQEKKDGLKARYNEAKKLGEQVNTSRLAINSLKEEIQQLKASGDNKSSDERQIEVRENLENEKAVYKHAFNSLKSIKKEIEHMQHLLETSKLKLQHDFQQWWAMQIQQDTDTFTYENEEPNNNNSASRGSDSRNKENISEYRRKVEAKHNEKSQDHRTDGSEKSVYRINDSEKSRDEVASRSSRSHSSSRSIQLTGDEETDNDIRQFMKARQNLLKKVKK